MWLSGSRRHRDAPLSTIEPDDSHVLSGARAHTRMTRWLALEGNLSVSGLVVDDGASMDQSNVESWVQEKGSACAPLGLPLRSGWFVHQCVDALPAVDRGAGGEGGFLRR